MKRKVRAMQVVHPFCGCAMVYNENNVGSEGEEDEWDKMKMHTFTWLVKDVIKRERAISYA